MLNKSKNKKIKSKLFKKRCKLKYTRNSCKITFNFIPQIIFLYYKDGDAANPATTHSYEHFDYYIVFYIVNLGNYNMFAKEYTRVTYYRKIVF